MSVASPELALYYEIGKIFSQAQLTTTNHHKNKTRLYLHHEKANNTSAKLDDDECLTAFQNTFKMQVITALRAKKGASGDNVIKFISGYIEYIRTREDEHKAQYGEPDDHKESFQFYLVKAVVKLLCDAVGSPDKIIRFRATQLLAHLTPSMGLITNKLYNTLRTCLVGRLKDKEASVRAQAVIAFSKLIKDKHGIEDHTLAQGHSSSVETLSEVITFDPIGDVRREALIGLPVSKKSVRVVIDSTRDPDASVRKAIYTLVLQSGLTNANDEPTAYHPLKLLSKEKAKLITNGTKDREESVRKATGKLLIKWLECLAVKDKKEVQPIEEVLALLSLFDLTHESAALALKSVFETREDLFTGLTFDDQFWLSLKVEKSKQRAFIARVYVEYCAEKKKGEQLDKSIPTMTDYADIVKHIYGSYVESTEECRSDQESKELQQNIYDTKFILGEMLKLAASLPDDFGDENGCRTMRGVILDMLPNHDLPPELIEPTCALLGRVTPDVDEKVLIQDLVDIVAEIRQEGPELTIKAEPIDVELAAGGILYSSESAELRASELRCLNVANGILKAMKGPLVDLTQLKQDVITKISHPAMASTNIELRRQGYLCLAYCCLLSRPLALFYLKDFSRIIRQTTMPKFCVTAAQALFDILWLHGHELIRIENNEQNVLDVVLPLLKDSNAEIQAVAGQGLSKLVLAGILNQDLVLIELIKAFVKPHFRHNNALRQWLTQFFAIYPVASPRNQQRLCDVFLPCFRDVINPLRDADDSNSMKPQDFIKMYTDWTRPILDGPSTGIEERLKPDDHIQFNLANALVKELYDEKVQDADKKLLCQMLTKLHVPDEPDLYQLKVYKVLIDNLPLRRPLGDKAAKDFEKYTKNINTRFKDQLEPISYDEMRKMEELHDLFKFVDEIMDDSGPTEDVDNRVKRERSEDSLFSADSSTAATPKGNKRRRISQIDDSHSNSTGSGQSPAGPSHRTPPQVTEHTDNEVIVISSDSEDENATTPLPRKRPTAIASRRNKPPRVPPPPESDSDVGEIPYDSIMDDSEDEEGQVLDLLAGSDAD